MIDPDTKERLEALNKKHIKPPAQPRVLAVVNLPMKTRDDNGTHKIEDQTFRAVRVGNNIIVEQYHGLNAKGDETWMEAGWLAKNTPDIRIAVGLLLELDERNIAQELASDVRLASALPAEFDDGSAIVVDSYAGGAHAGADRYKPFPARLTLRYIPSDTSAAEEVMAYIPSLYGAN